MELYKIPLWIEDIDCVIKNLPELDLFSGKSILITGAYGLICSAVVDIISRYNETYGKNIRIYAAGRSKKKTFERFGNLTNRDNFNFVKYDATKNVNKLDFTVDYIIHGAGNANPSLYLAEPVETMLGNFLGLKNLLDYSKDHHVKRLLYISSSEVYGQKKSLEPSRENDYGFIEILNPRNSYAVAKRAAETLCIAYNKEYCVNTVIVRPGHIYGPTASPHDNRVASAWAFAAARGEDIVMKSSGEQIRSYCYCLDCASAILKVLSNGDSGHAYNISNPDSVISIRELAVYLAKSSGVNLRFEIPSENEKQGFNPMQNSSLAATELLKLGWKGLFLPQTGCEHTVQIIKEF